MPKAKHHAIQNVMGFHFSFTFSKTIMITPMTSQEILTFDPGDFFSWLETEVSGLCWSTPVRVGLNCLYTNSSKCLNTSTFTHTSEKSDVKRSIMLMAASCYCLLLSSPSRSSTFISWPEQGCLFVMESGKSGMLILLIKIGLFE